MENHESLYRLNKSDQESKGIFYWVNEMDTANDRYEKQRRAAERQRERAKAKMADPAYQQHQKEKRQAAAERQRERQREKWRTAALKPKSPVVTSTRKKASRGLKGRTPTAAERRVMDALGRLPCVACALHGQFQPLISLHHIDGREKQGAHSRLLPLCNWHHQEAAPKAVREQYPWLVPVHACGNTGGKAIFTALNASEEELLQMAYEQAGLSLEAA